MSERIAIIGASQSGKSWFCQKEIVPHFRYVHYFGPEHNIKSYEASLAPGALIRTNTEPQKAQMVLDNATKWLKENPNKNIPKQLLVFDDVIDKDFVNSDLCRQLFAAGRHYNLSIVIMAHSPNGVITRYIKTNLTQIVLCQFYHSTPFEEIIEDYFLSMLYTGSESKQALNTKARELLNETFKYRFGKLIIRPADNTWSQWFPKERELKPDPRQDRPIILWQPDQKMPKKRDPNIQRFMRLIDQHADQEGQ